MSIALMGAEGRLDRTMFLVEANSFEVLTLWQQVAGPEGGRMPSAYKRPLTWEQINPGYLVTVGKIGKRPVCLNLSWVRIDGQLVCFWEQCSQVTDSLRSEKWLEKHFKGTYDDGRPPISIKAMPEGSIVYPNEPVVQVTNLVPGFGELAAFPESKVAQCWGPTERVTQSRHWLKEMIRMVLSVEPDLTPAEAQFKASCMLHDFGDRAGLSMEESEEQGMYHLFTFGGTDTFCGGYQAWHWDSFLGDVPTPGIFVSVLALAHRNVQAFELENDCYVHMFEMAHDGEILSKVGDCYDFYNAVENYLLPLALRSQREKSGKIVVARPDSGDALEQVTWICRLAKRHGLYTERVINGKTWYFPTTLHFIEGDGMDFGMMRKICDALIEQGFPPYAWGLFGVGGGLRNNLKRDNLSAKYALAFAGTSPRVKFSETLGKTTLPGPFRILRSAEALAARKTILFESEAGPGQNSLVEHFNGANLEKPFGDIMWERFRDVKARIDKQFPSMPLSLETADNHNYPASDAVRAKRLELLVRYAPKKRKENY